MHAFWDYVLSPVGWGVPGSCDLPPPTLESRARPWWSDVNEPNIKPHCHVGGIRYGNKKSESDYLKTLADRVFRPAGDSTHNSWQTHASLRLYTAATFVYLQRGGCSHCRHNDVTVTSRTDLCTDHSGCVNNEWADISAQRQYAAVQIYIHYWSHARFNHMTKMIQHSKVFQREIWGFNPSFHLQNFSQWCVYKSTVPVLTPFPFKSEIFHKKTWKIVHQFNIFESPRLGPLLENSWSRPCEPPPL